MQQQQQTNERSPIQLTAILVLVGMIVAGVWVWKRLPTETQIFLIDHAVPIAAGAATVGAVVLLAIRNIRRRIARRRKRDRLLASFRQEADPDRKLALSFELIECNGYRIDGLESVSPALRTLWDHTLLHSPGDERHRVRGMAASHLGLLRDNSVLPLLLRALEDDHAYVRACAALGLGRLRALEAKPKLEYLAKEDWDQTVRSRCREALDQLRYVSPEKS
ncbi:MAG: HEAT repeat domain-containing protein [Nitrospira sp.]|nr:HEAT repeat domain-containing protein [Nitrospira sp.]MCP9461727.1 HEAT repeat domain-containing protein [Nitrospira sp.]MCP9475690.1 HEAT repeat domain-containing protein [Nitrospira sp.]